MISIFNIALGLVAGLLLRSAIDQLAEVCVRMKEDKDFNKQWRTARYSKTDSEKEGRR